MRRSLVHPTESNSPILPVLGLGSQVRACWPGGRGKALNNQYKGGGQQLEITPFFLTLLTWERTSDHIGSHDIGVKVLDRGKWWSFDVAYFQEKKRSSLDNRRSLNVCL